MPYVHTIAVLALQLFPSFAFSYSFLVAFFSAAFWGRFVQSTAGSFANICQYINSCIPQLTSYSTELALCFKSIYGLALHGL